MATTTSWRPCCSNKQQQQQQQQSVNSLATSSSRGVQCGLLHAFSRKRTLQSASLRLPAAAGAAGAASRVAASFSRLVVPIRSKAVDSTELLVPDDVPGSVSAPHFKRGPWTLKDVGFASLMLVLHGLCVFAPFTFSWRCFGVFLGLYFVTGLLGITLSYHRNLAHRSFKLPKWLEYTFAYFGALAMQGDPIEWVNVHRGHHQHCDSDRDPHSPLVRGFWHSHMGWIFESCSIHEKVPELSNVKDLAGDPFYRFLARTYVVHPLMLAGLLYATGGVPYIIWGVAVRTVWVYHITWLVNSAAHIWGTQQWRTGDLSRNNWWVALLAFGEGWHNNHHAFEYSARHGLEWWQIDMTWYCVRLLQALGLATKVRLPSKEHKLKFSLS